MIVVFTGAFSGQAGTTTNMAALALYLAEERKIRTLLMPLQPEHNLLDKYLGGRKRRFQAGEEEKGTGIEACRKLIKAGLADREGVEGCMTRIGKYLDLLPGNFPEDLARCSREYTEAMPDMLDYLSRFYELIFCDAGDGSSALLRCIQEKAALLVRNVSQNTGLLDSCFKEDIKYQSCCAIFYLFGCYDRQSKYSLHNLRCKYHKLSHANSAFLPYCTEIRDACSDGNLQRALGKWRVAAAAGEYREYYIELKNCADGMLRLLERRGEKFI